MIVCEISSSNLQGVSPTSCGTDISGTGFVTTYTYTTETSDALQVTTVTQGAQTRVFKVDSLGRTVYTSEPEVGVTTYAYSYSGTAGLGLMVVRQKPQANQGNPSTLTKTTTQYDNNGGYVCQGSNQPSCTNGTQVYGFNASYAGTHVTNTCDTVLGICNSFSYDEFNRLSARTVTQGTVQNYTYNYDRYGNRGRKMHRRAVLLQVLVSTSQITSLTRRATQTMLLAMSQMTASTFIGSTQTAM